MDKNTVERPRDWREARRRRAWELKHKGWKQTAIAEALGVSKGAVSQWLKAAQEGGAGALRTRKGGGPKRRLSDGQLDELPALLARGAEAFGFRGPVWTRARVRAVIQRVFGVTYSLTQVGRVLKHSGFSRQKPVERASQRDEAALARWRTETWQEIKKKPGRKDALSCL